MGSSILVVDDELDICAILTQQLKKLGFQATYSLTIKDALEQISTHNYDIIFVDLNLTDGSGYDLLTSLRKDVRGSKVVVISAYDAERSKAMENGAHLFVPKPFTGHSIQAALQQLKALSS